LLKRSITDINDLMTEVLQKNIALVLGIIVCALVCVPAARWAVFHTGAPGPSILQAESPIVAAVLMILLVGIAAAVAGVVARFSNAAIGLFALGAGVFVMARRMGTAEQLIFGEGSLALVGFETLLWAALVLACTLVVFAIGGPLKDIEPDIAGRHPDPFVSREAMVCAGAGVVMILLVWIVAQSPMKGQVLGATFLGGVGAGLAGRLMSPHVQPILLFASPLVFGGLAHLICAVMLTQSPDVALVAGQLSTVSKAMPADYAAGALMGVAFGLGWAKSFLHHEEDGPRTAS
jgi:hypothetical protein